MGVGMVPIYEEQSARIEKGYTVAQWLALEPMERAIVIAVRRTENAAKNLQSEAESKKMKRDAAKARRK